MAILKDLAQVLHVYEQGNTSQIVVFLGRQLGQFRIHAKGSRRWPRKGFEGGFDLLTRGEILVFPRRGEGLWLMKEWDEHARPALGRSLSQLRAASFLCELAEALTRHTAGSQLESLTDENPSLTLYDELAAASDALAQGQRIGSVLLSFTLKALEAEGVLPEFSACQACGRKLDPRPKRIWLSREGVACEPCRSQPEGSAQNQPGTWLSTEGAAALRHLASTSRPLRLSASAGDQLARALVLLIHGALEHDLRTLSFAVKAVRALGATK